MSSVRIRLGLWATAILCVLFTLPALLPRSSCAAIQAAKPEPNWEPIGEGVAYARDVVAAGGGSVPIHLLKVDLNRAMLKPLISARFSSASRVKDYAVGSPDALAVFNGSFFDESPQGGELPKGIVVSDGKIHHDLLRSRPWGVFFTTRQGAYITSPEAYRHSGSIQFAVQGFPRLVERGRILRFKPQNSQRTALGILGSRKVLVLVTRDGASLSLQDLARDLRDRGCQSALNLDGGSSTQLWVRKPRASPLIEHGSNKIPVAIGVFRRR